MSFLRCQVIIAWVIATSQVAVARTAIERQASSSRFNYTKFAVRLISDKQAVTLAESSSSAADKIRSLLADVDNEQEEYKAIPKIWETAIAVSKANDTDEISALLQLAIPKADEPLRHWQAVVLGGSVINGLTQAGVWPRTRLEQLTSSDKALAARWQRTLRLASAMADNEKVPPGTRYDALRILGVDSFEHGQKQLVRYMAKDAHPELQMGAVSALGDINDPQATTAILTHLEGLTDANRDLAIDALLRTDERAKALLDFMNSGKLTGVTLNSKQRERLEERTTKRVLPTK